MSDLSTRRGAAPADAPSDDTPSGGPPPDALAPVRTALRRAARADAEATRVRADRNAQDILDAATARAATILEQARDQGRAEAAVLLAAETARARRNAREAELAVRREAFDALRARVTALLREAGTGPDAEPIAQRLCATARARLGPDAVLTPADSGGIIGRAPGRFVDASCAVLADRAVEALGDRVEQLWMA